MKQRSEIPPRASAPRRPTQAPRTTEEHTAHSSQTRPSADVWEEVEGETRVPHPGRSARRYTVAEQHPDHQLARLPSPRPVRTPRHPLLYMGVGMASATILAAAWLVGGNWWQQQTDTWTYGYPRTYQTNAVVGHADSTSHPSHFLAENLHGQILVIEFPGSDPTHGRDFFITTLFGPGADLAPVTLSFADVNHDGKLDLLVHVDGQIMVYLNENGTFRPLKPGEQVDPLPEA